MSLREWQSSLGMLVGSNPSVNDQHALNALQLDERNLSVIERDWLQSVVGSTGLSVTSSIQRWWRGTRLRFAVRFTRAILGSEQFEGLALAYFQSVPCTSLFFTPEAVAFLDFVIAQRLPIVHLDSVARFERA